MITDSVTIDGDIDNDAAADITISADSRLNANDSDSAVIRIFGSGSQVVLEGLTLRDGNSLTANGAGFGGAIQVGTGAGDLTLLNSSVLDSQSESDGGGVHIQDGTLILTNSTVSWKQHLG